jgi:hypothetical protein
MPQKPIDVDFTPEMEEIPNVVKVWRTRSKSRPNTHHFTWLYDTGVAACTCEGFVYQNKCWHVTAVQVADEDFDVSI